jgi:hypothetical protein
MKLLEPSTKNGRFRRTVLEGRQLMTVDDFDLPKSGWRSPRV